MALLNAEQRKALPDSAFAIVKKVNGKTERDYPIQDLAHARDALSRVATNGTPAEQAAVRAAVAKRYPKLAKNHALLRRATGQK